MKWKNSNLMFHYSGGFLFVFLCVKLRANVQIVAAGNLALLSIFYKTSNRFNAILSI